MPLIIKFVIFKLAEQSSANSDVRQPGDLCAVQASNPFMFKHVTHLKSSQHLDDIGPCVVMATPSMLQSGLSRYTCPKFWLSLAETLHNLHQHAVLCERW